MGRGRRDVIRRLGSLNRLPGRGNLYELGMLGRRLRFNDSDFGERTVGLERSAA